MLKNFRTVHNLAGRDGIKLVYLSVLVSFLAALSELFLAVQIPFILSKLMDTNLSSLPTWLKQDFVSYELLFLFTVIINFLLRGSTIAFNILISLKLGHLLLAKTFQRLLFISFEDENLSVKEKPTAIMHTKNQMIVNNLFTPIIMVISNMLMAISLIIAVIIFGGLKVITFGIIGGVLYCLILILVSSFVTSEATKYYKFIELFISQIRSIFDNRAEVLSYSLTEIFGNNLKKIDLQMRRRLASIQIIEQSPRLIIDLLAMIGILAFSTFSLAPYWSEANLNLIVVTFYALFRLIPIFNSIYANLVKFFKGLPAAQETETILKSKSIDYIGSASPKIKNLRFENVCMEIKEQKIFSGVYFDLKIGDRLGIYGPSGTGKTTLAKIIGGIVKKSSGNIFVNSKKTEDIYDNLLWLNKVLYIQQKPIIFPNDLYFNISLGKNISLRELKKHFRYLNLQLEDDDFFKLNPENFSLGMQQRLSLVRAYFSKKPIIIFDEITSGLDKANEERANKYIKTFFKDKMIVLVSHKIGTLKICNKKILLNK